MSETSNYQHVSKTKRMYTQPTKANQTQQILSL